MRIALAAVVLLLAAPMAGPGHQPDPDLWLGRARVRLHAGPARDERMSAGSIAVPISGCNGTVADAPDVNLMWRGGSTLYIYSNSARTRRCSSTFPTATGPATTTRSGRTRSSSSATPRPGLYNIWSGTYRRWHGRGHGHDLRDRPAVAAAGRIRPSQRGTRRRLPRSPFQAAVQPRRAHPVYHLIRSFATRHPTHPHAPFLLAAALGAASARRPVGPALRTDARPVGGTLRPQADRPAETLGLTLRAVSETGIDELPRLRRPVRARRCRRVAWR